MAGMSGLLSSRNLDEKLVVATLATLDSSNTPGNLIKQDLKFIIQSRRRAEGKEEIEVEFKKPVKEELTGEEINKRARRRELNRLAARRSREKGQKRKDKFVDEIRHLQSHNSSLLTCLSSLTDHRNQMIEDLRHHMKQCSDYQATQNASVGLSHRVLEMLGFTQPSAMSDNFGTSDPESEEIRTLSHHGALISTALPEMSSLGEPSLSHNHQRTYSYDESSSSIMDSPYHLTPYEDDDDSMMDAVAQSNLSNDEEDEDEDSSIPVSLHHHGGQEYSLHSQHSPHTHGSPSHHITTLTPLVHTHLEPSGDPLLPTTIMMSPPHCQSPDIKVKEEVPVYPQLSPVMEKLPSTLRMEDTSSSLPFPSFTGHSNPGAPYLPSAGASAPSSPRGRLIMDASVHLSLAAKLALTRRSSVSESVPYPPPYVDTSTLTHATPLHIDTVTHSSSSSTQVSAQSSPMKSSPSVFQGQQPGMGGARVQTQANETPQGSL